MIVAIAFDRVGGFAIVMMLIAMLIAMLVGAHGVMIVRAILSARQRRGQPDQCERGQCCQGRFPKMLAHVAILEGNGWVMLRAPPKHANSRALTGPVGDSLRGEC